jgi:hypothetical protein
MLLKALKTNIHALLLETTQAERQLNHNGTHRTDIEETNTTRGMGPSIGGASPPSSRLLLKPRFALPCHILPGQRTLGNGSYLSYWARTWLKHCYPGGGGGSFPIQLLYSIMGSSLQRHRPSRALAHLRTCALAHFSGVSQLVREVILRSTEYR